MIKFILITIAFLLTLTKGSGQTNIYHAFPDSNGVWSEVYNENPCYCPSPPPWSQPCSYSCGDYKKKMILGDTIIGSYNYHKIYTFTSHFQYNGNFPATTQFSFGLRQDTVNKKVYVFVPFVGDTLLYDFNLQVGDTLPVSYISPQGSNYVSFIDSILIGNSYRELYHIGAVGFPQASDYTFLIEGIGSGFGISEKLDMPFETTNTLNCFSQNDSTLYINSFSTGECYMALGKKSIATLESTLKIYPNPFVSSSTIATSVQGATVNIYDLFGQQVKTINSVTNQTTILKRDNLPCGLYFIHLIKDNKLLAKTKFIISDN